MRRCTGAFVLWISIQNRKSFISARKSRFLTSTHQKHRSKWTKASYCDVAQVRCCTEIAAASKASRRRSYSRSDW